MADEPAQENNGKQLQLQKIYIKDLSFESPRAPQIFTSDAQAETQLNMRTSHTNLDEQNVEVCLTITVESKDKDATLFLVEVVQAGVFSLRGYTEAETSAILGSYCPNTLYPFAREAVADIATKGGFPQLLLQPINFDGLYQQALQERAAQATAGGPVDVTMPPQAPADPAAGGGTH